MFLQSLRLALKLLIFIFLTVITQIGGIIYLFTELLFKRHSKFYLLKKLFVFLFLYLSASFFLVPYVAKYFGREPIIENHTYLYLTYKKMGIKYDKKIITDFTKEIDNSAILFNNLVNRVCACIL